jgi:hypothetical protein
MKIVGSRPWTATLLVAALALASASPVVADPVTLRTCDRAADVGPDATYCVGYVKGSDNVPDVGKLIEAAGWGGFGGVRPEEFDNFDVDLDKIDPSKGLLTVLADLDGPFVLALRGKSAWAAYYYAQGAVADTEVSFDLPGEGKDAALSRVSVYVPGAITTRTLTPEPQASVPEPSGFAALIPGLLAIGFVARRRRRG